MLSLTKITRSEMGAYLCIASNGVPPSVSKRMKLQVHCESLTRFRIASFPPHFDSLWFMSTITVEVALFEAFHLHPQGKRFFITI
jgi:hypothetical protein